MKSIRILLVAVMFLFATAALTSCQMMGGKEQTVCGQCGQIEGKESCCQEGAEVCAKCGLHKGSPGCCKIEKGAGSVAVCGKCGEPMGSEACCAK